jgi:hypothetical protein
MIPLPVHIFSLYSWNFLLRKIRISWFTCGFYEVTPMLLNISNRSLFFSPVLRHASGSFNIQHTRIRCLCSSWNFALFILPSFMIYTSFYNVTPVLLNISNHSALIFRPLLKTSKWYFQRSAHMDKMLL